jgi:NRAMP (natural resistance-associated macrophage protein)-like metal ion transporter
MTLVNIPKKLKKFFKILGPGFVTGASDDDPSGIGTYSQTGALFGYSQLWTALYALPFTIFVQEMCGRIGMVTGRGLAGVLKKYYSKPTLYFCVFLLLIANTINIGADLGAMAASAQLLIPLPFTVLLLAMTIITLLLEVFVSYKTYAKYLKYLALSLFAYVIAVFVVTQDWGRVLSATLIPHIELSRDYLFNLVAILGTTIAPYLFFWQASQEVEEEVAQHKITDMDTTKPFVTNSDIRSMHVDTASGMIFSNLITFFIIATTASTLFTHGIHNVETASQAAESLLPLAGNFAFLLFTIGIIGTGLLAVPVLAGSASYAFSEAFGWKEGLYKKLPRHMDFTVS